MNFYRDLWPINTENVDDLDMPLIRATARKKFYKSAIQTLQQISSHFNPISKLAALVDTFTEIEAAVELHSNCAILLGMINYHFPSPSSSSITLCYPSPELSLQFSVDNVQILQLLGEKKRSASFTDASDSSDNPEEAACQLTI
ncbi:unnamed protein product [Onchocerca flexuosa]|uniref:NR LBD domain-containing protein n=1 Tax=Onchocerca flexuosa TaxID=387005 RepID=A0A183HEF5_9BILA|nr:unnamed protein product [Onchocerca flexuosa]